MNLLMILALTGFFVSNSTYLLIVFKGIAGIVFVLSLIWISQLFPTLIKARAIGIS